MRELFNNPEIMAEAYERSFLKWNLRVLAFALAGVLLGSCASTYTDPYAHQRVSPG